MLTQPALMQIGWFAWVYEAIMPWKEALVDRVRSSWLWRVSRLWKERGKRIVAAQWRAWRPAVLRMRTKAAAAAAQFEPQFRRIVQDIRARLAALQR